VVLCVNNLTSRPQASTVRVPEEYAGAQSLDLFGGSGFPKVSDDGTLSLTLGSRDFFWLQLQTGAARG
jgi:maltose alpha-D-glucosyltransferase/alpha-amylase